MMSAETRKVLEMLAAGKITSQDAERLLDKLAATPDAAGNDHRSGVAPAGAPKKFLRVLIERPGGDDVNVRVPLSFVRSGVKLAGILPPQSSRSCTPKASIPGSSPARPKSRSMNFTSTWKPSQASTSACSASSAA